MTADEPRSVLPNDSAPSLPAGYEIRGLAIDDARGLAEAYLRNREHLAPWEPDRPPEFFTESWHRQAVAAKVAAADAGQQDPCVIFYRDEVVGRVNLTNIVRGVFQSCSLGYWVDRRHTGQGIATAAVKHALQRAAAMGLHRVEAGTLTHNEGSQVVLRRCGFTLIGMAPDYLFIADQWQDHLIYQRILHLRRPS